MSTRLLLNVARPWAEGDPARLAADAIAAGADGVGFADSPRLFPDAWLEAERFLGRSATGLAGPCVLGLGLHHPSVVAQSALTLARHHPGRSFTVVGRGESSVRNEGRPVPTLAAYVAGLDALRERLSTADGAGPLVLGAASGPRTISASAQRLPGVLLDAGADPGVIAKAVETARTASSDVRCWLFLRIVRTRSAAERAAAGTPMLGSCAARLAAAPEWYEVPADRRDAVAALAAGFDYRTHGTAAVPTIDPDVADLIHDRFLVTGDEAVLTARLRPLSALGLDGVVIAGATAGLLANLGPTLAALRRGLSTVIDEPQRPEGRSR